MNVARLFSIGLSAANDNNLANAYRELARSLARYLVGGQKSWLSSSQINELVVPLIGTQIVSEPLIAHGAHWLRSR